jgi:yersiniabactin nonribosomal peptide synthetase
VTSQPRDDDLSAGGSRFAGGPESAGGPARPDSPASLTAAVAATLDADPAAICADDDLIGWGLDSIRLMVLASVWQRAGIEITFAELIEQPTVRSWWKLLSASQEPAEPAAAGPPAAQRAAAERAAVDESAPFELAPMQQAYWVGRGQDRALGGVNAHFYAELDGTGVEPGRLEGAVRALLRRHGMLRARFLDDGRQQILPDSPWSGVTVHDLRDRPAEDAAAELARLRERLSRRQLRVEAGEVFDVQLSVLPDNRTRLHVNIDMLAADAHSFRIILDELARRYDRPAEPLPPIDYSFPGYLADQAIRRAGARDRARAYWQQRLGELPGGPQLPLAIDPELVSGHGVARRYQQVPAEHWRELTARARAHGLTLPAVLITAFAETIAAWTPEPRFLLSLPLFDREHLNDAVPALVGDFTSLLMLSVDAAGELPFAQRARALQRQLQADLSHPEYSGLEVLRDLARLRPGDWALAPVAFTSAIGIGELFSAEVRRCLGTPGWTTSQTPQVWLDQQVTERDGGLFFNWDVVEELFPAGLLDAMFGAHLGLVTWLGAPGSDWSGPLPALLPRDQADVRAGVNATAGPAPAGLLHEEFLARAARQPDALALADAGGAPVSYGELAGAARRVAGLLAARGLRPGEPVAVTLPRGRAQIEAVLGVLLAGGAYVPVGTDQPAHRRAVIYSRAGVRLVLADVVPEPGEAAPELDDVELVPVALAAAAEPADPVAVSPDSLAYVIYTSGSTGEPKGVEITHRSAVNTIDDINARFGVGASDRLLAVSALDFDLSVYDIFGPLSAGGAVVLIEDDDRREAGQWVTLIRRWGVTVWNSVPTLLEMLLDGCGPDGLGSSLRLALVSGDWVGLDLPARLRAEVPGARLVALGGATEAAIWSNAIEVGDVPLHWRSIPYGTPLRNQKYRVVDSRGRDAPDWVPGELWIGGLGVARGYRADPQVTARQFVEHQGERWYRTGDLGRYWPDGTLEFLGRADHQVKIRGHRIELGEVEAALEATAGVAKAVATTVGPEPRQLVAVIVAREPGLDPASVRPLLAERLPAYMLPSQVTVVDALPTSANGKVDRQAAARLAAAARLDRSGDREPPTGPVETALARLWREFLPTAVAGRDESFFALGGDSLLATRLVDEVRRRLGVTVTLRRLFATPTIRDLAVLITAELGGDDDDYEEGIV